MSNQSEVTHEQKVIKAKQLYNQGSRNYLAKSYDEAADQLSEACSIYEEVYGELSNALGMPYLLYAKSLIALALDENKELHMEEEHKKSQNQTIESGMKRQHREDVIQQNQLRSSETLKPSSSKNSEDNMISTSKCVNAISNESSPGAADYIGDKNGCEESELACNLQLAWEVLEIAAKIFSRQGMSGLLNLAEVFTELANIEFENNILDSAREDYKKALNIYNELTDKHRRAMAEIYYKIGLCYAMQQFYQEAIDNLKLATHLIEDEIVVVTANNILIERDKELIQHMEETKQAICARIVDIEEIKEQNIKKHCTTLDEGNNVCEKQYAEEHMASSKQPAIATSTNTLDITHLIKRKRTELTSFKTELERPAKKPTT